jgi:hypothetical protein
MELPFDIFEMGAGGRLQWCYAAESFAHAQRCVEAFAPVCPGEYLIFDQNTRKMTVVTAVNRLPDPSSHHVSGSTQNFRSRLDDAQSHD